MMRFHRMRISFVDSVILIDIRQQVYMIFKANADKQILRYSIENYLMSKKTLFVVICKESFLNISLHKR